MGCIGSDIIWVSSPRSDVKPVSKTADEELIGMNCQTMTRCKDYSARVLRPVYAKTVSIQSILSPSCHHKRLESPHCRVHTIGGINLIYAHSQGFWREVNQLDRNLHSPIIYVQANALFPMDGGMLFCVGARESCFFFFSFLNSEIREVLQEKYYTCLENSNLYPF